MLNAIFSCPFVILFSSSMNIYSGQRWIWWLIWWFQFISQSATQAVDIDIHHASPRANSNSFKRTKINFIMFESKFVIYYWFICFIIWQAHPPTILQHQHQHPRDLQLHSYLLLLLLLLHHHYQLIQQHCSINSFMHPTSSPSLSSSTNNIFIVQLSSTFCWLWWWIW